MDKKSQGVFEASEKDKIKLSMERSLDQNLDSVATRVEYCRVAG
jgi:hypothetical protein